MKTILCLIIVPLLLAASVIADDSRCIGVPDDNFVSNPKSCQHWFRCNNGIASSGSCPGFLWFDPITQACRYPLYVNCTYEDGIDVDCPEDEDLAFRPHPTSCEKYIICTRGIAHVISCADGLHWREETNQCDRPELAECVLEANVLCPVDVEIAFIPSPHLCERYYICFNGVPLRQYCAPGLHFDPIAMNCNFPNISNCEIYEPDIIPDPEDIDWTCGTDEPVYRVPHPHSCEHYILCVFGNHFVNSCAPTLLFDPINLRCDIPENVICPISKCYH